MLLLNFNQFQDLNERCLTVTSLDGLTSKYLRNDAIHAEIKMSAKLSRLSQDNHQTLMVSQFKFRLSRKTLNQHFTSHISGSWRLNQEVAQEYESR